MPVLFLLAFNEVHNQGKERDMNEEESMEFTKDILGAIRVMGLSKFDAAMGLMGIVIGLLKDDDMDFDEVQSEIEIAVTSVIHTIKTKEGEI